MLSLIITVTLQHFHRYSPSTQWVFHIKLGCTLVLLLWALSECINNELSERDIWNVSLRLSWFSSHARRLIL
jgi:hypothetical protein